MNGIRLASHSALRRPVHAVEHKRVALRFYTALAEMVNGTARREEWLDLSDSVNIVDALGVMGKYELTEVRPHVDAAIDGLMVAIKCPSGMMRMGAASTYAMRHVVTLHDEAIARFSAMTMREAWEMVVQKIADPRSTAETGLIVVDA